MIEIFIIKVIKENIKKGKYYTIDNKVISQNMGPTYLTNHLKILD